MFCVGAFDASTTSVIGAPLTAAAKSAAKIMGACYASRIASSCVPTSRHGYDCGMSTGQFPSLPAYPIKQRLELEGVNVLLLSIPPDQDYPQNIFGVSEKGDILWQIEPRPSTTPHNKYTSIRDEIGLLVARTEDGWQRKIDPKSGKVLTEEAAPKT